MTGSALIIMILKNLICCLVDADIRNPDIFYFFHGDVLEANGSSITGGCSIPQNIGIRTICEDVDSSVLFNDVIPALNFSNTMWAGQLFILHSSTNILLEWSSPTAFSSIEVVMFNCPEWGIAAQNVSFISKGQHVVSTVITQTSCGSLVRVCLLVPDIMYSSATLQLSLLPTAQQISIAEIVFHGSFVCSSHNSNMTNSSPMLSSKKSKHLSQLLAFQNAVKP